MAGTPPPRRPSETSLYTDAMALLSKKTRASMALHSAISISFQCFQALMAGPCDARGVHVHIITRPSSRQWRGKKKGGRVIVQHPGAGDKGLLKCCSADSANVSKGLRREG